MGSEFYRRNSSIGPIRTFPIGEVLLRVADFRSFFCRKEPVLSTFNVPLVAQKLTRVGQALEKCDRTNAVTGEAY